MKDYLYQENIEVKKTKINLVISQPIDSYSSAHDAATDLLVKTCLIGGSTNVINQLIDEGSLTDDDFENIAYAREQVLDIARELKIDLSARLKSVKPKNHRFY